ncbi:hypothetical protein N658DRAFT_495853 [Parathielavia hyrcaniae]|uniref:CBF1-interacting co-repressor CIR N-terminal domain-containing protein n=1 Tax=Parathielavia hyrcaniae TaxID=113614 RepID=A0AAN6Q320_9PEZI|nr:hypothetical protein N658DRAFT_495853 [Parathielavia hyrcaniae]
MPLHLLGKKSWNVYNPANIARVRRDEEAARAREEADEQRMQEADAARRLATLRGEIPPPLNEPNPEAAAALPPSRSHDPNNHPGTSRKRKRPGEDDTDFELRIARERASLAGGAAARALAAAPPAPPPTSLVDSKGHITLFPEFEGEPARPREGNEDAAREAARKERELKDQYQMRFVNAGGGRDGLGLTDGGPWYVSAAADAGEASSGALVPSRNVWGREDPKRRVREAARLDASDPLAAMKSGARMVREMERERRKDVEERERALRELEKEERRERKRREGKRRRRGEEEEDRAGRGRRMDGSEREDGSERRDRYRDCSASWDRKRDRSEGRKGHSRDRRDRRGDSPDRRERSHRHHEERRRERSQESRREHRHDRRPHRLDHDRNRDEPDSKQR